ncbi:MurR/RpiR family transcriptional regulator [Enterococcus larvae]|uniref:MurR/RpiR family transcriptional regulator n=1 Tax=Enterococcus larvae TaxID=2794352 RepID=UPI003F32EC4B
MFDIFDFLTYLNTHGKETTYSKIILFLLTHPEEVPSLTISEIAEKCYVSPATLTRFSRHFRFASFADLRDALQQLDGITPYSGLRMNEKDFQLLQKDPKAYLTSYSEEITASIHDVLKTIDIEEIDQLLHKIHVASEVVLIGYSSTLELAKEVQSAFLSSRKILYIGETEQLQKELIDQLDKNALIIVISSYGTLLTKNHELTRKISQSPADSIFITQNTKNTLTNQFTQTIRVTKENYVQIGTYPLTFFFDYFTRRYVSLFEK